MINLMYLVLMAMLALNISTEVLNGFSIVEESLNRTTANSSKENEVLYADFADQMKANPQKVKEWFEKATAVKRMSDSLYNYAQQLKIEIVREADGKDADVANIKNKDDLEAASHVMLAPGTGQGGRLFRAINSFRERILTMVTDPHQRSIIESNLTTKLPAKAHTMGKNWQEYMFEDMPVAGAVTLLSKLQSDVRYAEGEVLHSLVANIDMKDIRVNRLSAFVIPESRTVISGDQFAAQIVMAAVDTTQQPEIYVGGRRISNGLYRFTANGVGEHSFGGYITMRDGAGNTIRRDFTQKYTVVAPSATVSADLMNVLYAGYDNPISVSIPGVPLSAVQASMSGAYIQIGSDRFRGGSMSKASLMGISGIKAAIDDGILDIQFRVTGFETVFFDNMGNAVPMASNSAHFTDRQRETFRKLSRGKRFYISRITAVGPDGITRKLNGAMEVIVK